MSDPQAKTDLQIPFKPNGSIYRHVSRYQSPEWRDNHKFVAILEFQDSQRSRSSVTYIFKDLQGNEHYMMVKDMTDALKAGAFEGRILQGVFTYVKRGQQYGTRFLGRAVEFDSGE